jgi:hypothetical protein
VIFTNGKNIFAAAICDNLTKSTQREVLQSVTLSPTSSNLHLSQENVESFIKTTQPQYTSFALYGDKFFITTMLRGLFFLGMMQSP